MNTMTQLTETTNKFNQPLCLAFVDCERAFDSGEQCAVLNSVCERGAKEHIICLLHNIYTKGMSAIILHRNPGKYIKGGNIDALLVSKVFFITTKANWNQRGCIHLGETQVVQGSFQTHRFFTVRRGRHDTILSDNHQPSNAPSTVKRRGHYDSLFNRFFFFFFLRYPFILSIFVFFRRVFNISL